MAAAAAVVGSDACIVTRSMTRLSPWLSDLACCLPSPCTLLHAASYFCRSFFPNRHAEGHGRFTLLSRGAGT